MLTLISQMRADHAAPDDTTTSSLRISSNVIEGCLLISISGELWRETMREFPEAIAAHAASTQPVVIDVSNLDFLGSGGVFELASFKPASGKAIVVCPPGHVLRVLGIERVRSLVVCESASEALAAAAAAAKVPALPPPEHESSN